MKPNIVSVAIIIPALNEEKYIESCLNSVMKLDSEDYELEVIVIDNGSTDRTVDIVKQFPAVRLSSRKNCNVGAVRNYGVSVSSSNLLVFLDADCVVPQNWLVHGLEHIRKDPKTVLGGCFTIRQGASWVEKGWILNEARGSGSGNHLAGASIFCTKDAFSKIGGFNESITSNEDSEFGISAKEKGFRVQIDGGLLSIHLGYPSSLAEFFERQVWHGENIAARWPRVLYEKTFKVTILFALGLIGMVLGIFTLELSLLIPAACVCFLLSLMLTMKRAIRARMPLFDIKRFMFGAVLDFVYLFGRVIGLYRSFFHKKRVGSH